MKRGVPVCDLSVRRAPARGPVWEHAPMRNRRRGPARGPVWEHAPMRNRRRGPARGPVWEHAPMRNRHVLLHDVCILFHRYSEQYKKTSFMTCVGVFV